MPDPRVLYAVMAVVTTGLLAWVVLSNWLAPKITPPASAALQTREAGDSPKKD